MVIGCFRKYFHVQIPRLIIGLDLSHVRIAGYLFDLPPPYHVPNCNSADACIFSGKFAFQSLHDIDCKGLIKPLIQTEAGIDAASF